MCLSIPSEILEIDELNNALVQTLGVKRKVNIKEATRLIKELNPRADIITLDAKNGTNMELWYKVLKLKKELF